MRFQYVPSIILVTTHNVTQPDLEFAEEDIPNSPENMTLYPAKTIKTDWFRHESVM
jgi:hypothetical protein